MSMNAATSKISSKMSFNRPRPDPQPSNMQRGPFGQYAPGTTGHVLNSLAKLGVPIRVIEDLTIGDKGLLTKSGTAFGMYRYFDGLDIPLFMFTDSTYRLLYQPMVVDGDVLRPNFKPRLGPHMSAALIVEGREATLELYKFLMGMMSANFITDERYKLRQDAGAFFQGGFDNPNGQYFYIEFSKASGVMPFIEYINTNFCEVSQ